MWHYTYTNTRYIPWSQSVDSGNHLITIISYYFFSKNDQQRWKYFYYSGKKTVIKNSAIEFNNL